MQEITPPEGNTAVGVPLELHVSRCRCRRKINHLLRFEEVLCIGEQHLLDARVKDDG